jgi:hypothetical protein
VRFRPRGVATGSVRGSFFLLVRGRKRRHEGAPSEGSLDQGCHQEQPALASSSEDEVRVVELAEAGGATSTAQSLESSGGALAPADVGEGVKASFFTSGVGPFEQVLVS